MNSVAKFTLLLVLTISLSSCFEMVEELTYTNSNQGKYSITINCSQSRTKLKALFKLDTFMGIKVPPDYDVLRYIGYAAYSLENADGIHDVHTSSDFDQYIFTLSFNFDSTQALNKGLMDAVQTTTGKFTFKNINIFNYVSNNFYRMDTPGDSIAKANAKNNEVIKLIDGATLTSIYRFPDAITKVGNTKAIISKDRKAVMLKQSFSEILQNPEILKNHIQF